MPPRIYPARFLDFRPNRQAEQRVFAALATQLSPDYLVIHDAAWIHPGSPSFAQIDFVIVGPELGVLVLEVKGGRRLRSDGKQWSMETHNGEIISYKIPPHAQSERAMWALYELLRDRTNNQFPQGSVTYAVCFPDLIIDTSVFDASLDRHIVIDKQDLSDLPRTLQRIRRYWQLMRVRSHRGLGQKWFTEIRNILAREIDLQALLGAVLLAEHEESWSLAERYASTLFSQEQLTVLDRSELIRRFAVGGCAGSGKTLLAMALARRHAEKKRRVLLLCYNRPLSDRLRYWTTDVRRQIRVATFDELMHQTAEYIEVNLSNVPHSEQGAVVAEEAKVTTAWRGPVYDAIVVDEGQDFDSSWWPLVERYLADTKESFLVIFWDNNQRLYGRQEGLPVSARLPLSVNFRTTRAIHRLVDAFYIGESRPSEFAQDGENPRLVSYSGSTDDLRRRLFSLISELRGNGVNLQDIAVLTTRAAESSQLAHIADELQMTRDLQADGIAWETIYRFKGLERPVVIVVEIDPDIINREEADELLYVGYSRASKRLFVIHKSDVSVERLRQRISRAMVSKGDIISSLNDEQREAVTAHLGIQQIYAGAGTGKTRVLTHRIAYLIGECAVAPYSILAVTFTTKAAREIRERILRLCDPESTRAITVGTFHAICRRILQREIPHLQPPILEDRRADFSIISDKDARKLVTDLLKQNKSIDTDAVLAKIAEIKQNGQLITEAISSSRIETEILATARRYDQSLRQMNKVDFDDLLLLVVRLLIRHGEVLERVRARYKHILVDELQDTNSVQFDFIRLLSLGRGLPHVDLERSLLVVGDAQQSIYQWRGARYELFKDFPSHFPEVDIRALVINYRSTQHIIDVALSVAREDITGVPPLELIADKPSIATAQPVTLLTFPTDEDEATGIARTIRNLLVEGVAANQIAILIRARKGSPFAVDALKLLEDALIAERIRFQARGFESFHRSSVVQDTVALLWAALEPNRNEALRNAFNTRFFPKIGPVITDRLINLAKDRGHASLWEFLSELAQSTIFGVGGSTLQLTRLAIPDLAFQRDVIISEGFKLIHDIRLMTRDDNLLYTWLNRAITHADIRGRFGNQHSIEDINQLLQVLVAFLCEECKDVAELPTILSTFSSYEDATGDTSLGDDSDGVVQMMSIHAAKGLEFEVVILPALEDGLFPSNLDQSSRAELLEAGRLYYVAVTRPRRRLFLSYSQTRSGKTQRPSPFIEAVRSVVSTQSQWRVYVDAFAGEGNQLDIVLMEAVERPLSGRDWQAVERIAKDFPGSVPVYFLCVDTVGMPSEIDTGFLIDNCEEALELLSSTSGRRCTQVKRETHRF